MAVPEGMLRASYAPVGPAWAAGPEEHRSLPRTREKALASWSNIKLGQPAP